MVDEDWLAENRDHNDVPGRLADSGKLWGDKEDPEEIEARVAKVKEEKGRNKKRATTTVPDGGNKKKEKKGKGKEKETEAGKEAAKEKETEVNEVVANCEAGPQASGSGSG